MLITGIGTLGIFGFGKQALISAIAEEKTVDSYASLDIDIKTLSDKSLFKKLRRADRFTKMAVMAVDNALKDSSNKNINFENTGIIIATAFGPHNTTFAFLDELLEYGEKNVSPIKFSNSVHNAAASYIAQLFGVRGPITTISNFANPVEEAFTLASCWLNSNMCENILLCTVDERGEIYNQAYDKILNSLTAKLYPTEGSCCFLLQKNTSKDEHVYCTVSSHSQEYNRLRNKVDLIILESKNSSHTLTPGIAVKTFTEFYGNMNTGISFAFIIAVLILNREIDTENVEIIECLRYMCNGDYSSTNFSTVEHKTFKH
jgi:3-oxoacyl-[acyl-carrier-protein] synthase II